ncbi:MAG: alpha/beta hydrolase domain-containing protein [Planctomycetota bacterium]
MVDLPVATLPLAHRDHRAYPVLDPGDPACVLTVRDGREAPRTVVPRSTWSFSRATAGRPVEDGTHISLEGGFQAGKIYELVYRARDPRVIGMGLAAIRDTMAYALHDPDCPFPVKRGLAVGISQTGRFLRHFLYQGFNTDTEGRQVFDGMLILTAGAGRGSFNHRFAQPSRDAHRYSAFFYPTDLFPFTSRLQEDPVTGRMDGLFAHQFFPDHVPKIFYLNTGYEYWGRAAALVHSTVDGEHDFPPTGRERVYHLCGAQHFPGWFPPRSGDVIPGTRLWRGHPLDAKTLYRALLVRLVEWVGEDREPPASAFPLLDEGTLVPVAELALPAISGLAAPHVAHVAYRADYGPQWDRGIVTLQPPVLGPAFPARVPAVDALGNELGGVRGLELRVPLATYLPWNLRRGMAGGNGELTDFLGTFAPLPPTEAEKRRSQDPRPSLETLYGDRKGWKAQARKAAQAQVREGFLLEEDVPFVLEEGLRIWDWIEGGER